MTALRESGEQYREKLSARLEYLNGYLAMIRAFNEASAELTISLDDLSEGLRAPLEVASELEAVNMVENFQGVLQPSYVQLKTKFDALEPQGLELEEIAVQEEEIRGALTLYHVGDLRKALTILETTMSQREEELTGSDGLLKKEKQKEKKRVEFAMAATMLKKFITKNTHELGKLEDEMAKTEDLQPMLAKFQEFNNACQMETDDTMDRLGPMQDALDAAGVADNAHTPETVDSLRAASTMLLSRISVDMTSLESKIEIEEGHKRMAKEYDERADAFMAWIEGKMDTFQSREEGNKGFGDSTASIKETISVILKYKLEELPPMLQEQSSLSNHLVNLHNGQRSIHRPVHVPQDGRGTEDLAEKWDSLATVLVEYENAVRDSLAMFSTMESELLLITSKCGRVGEWIVVQQQVLDSHDYGNSLAGTRALEDNYNLFLKQLEVQKQAPVKVREALASNPRYELHAEYHVAIGKVEKLEKGLGEIETKGKYYLQGVRLSAQEYEKLSRLIEPEHWADQIDAVFEKADLGNNLADVQQRVSAFEENYTARLQEYLKMTEEMALMTNMSQQNYNRASVTSCMTKLDMVTLKLTALQAKATEYQQSLLTRQEVLTALIESMNEFNTMAAEFDVMVDALDEELSTPLIADSMEDVDNEISRFDEETREAMNAVTHKYTDIDTVARELLESEEVLAREAFARYELNNLYNRWQAIDQRTDEREMELKAEGTGYWAIEQHKENLRIEFAEKASIIRQYCTEKTDIVSSLSGDLDEQVATLAALKSDYDTSTLLTDVEPITQGLEEFMVLSNQHTADNYFTLKGQWEALGKVFGEASGSLQEQIMAEKGRQITPEQMAEIIEVFEFFDTDNSGFLTETEFWSCCTGIGLVLTKDEVESTFASLDTSGDQNVSLDEFSIWMADRLTQPSAASGDVVEAFHIINEWPVEYPPREEVKNSVANVRIKQCFFETETRDYLVESMGPHKCDLPAEVVEQAAEDQSADEDPTSKLEYTIVPYVDELFSR
uniref:EF-hand domain-containing protein n=1 Tax=Octactis speculum TaxID=3111310 RepID=A0A7S2FS21_9STRA